AHTLIEHILVSKSLDTSDDTYRSYFELLTSSDAIEHLFSVVAGIDSQIIGDQQIFSQVKDAFRISSEAQLTGSFLNKLSQAAFRVAKRVISETTLNIGAATISYAAVEFVRKIYDDLALRHILIIGAGESGELAAKHFIERSAGSITLANRTLDRAQEVATRLQTEDPRCTITTIVLDDIQSILPSIDIIVSATSASSFVLPRPMVNTALPDRTSTSPMEPGDFAVPGDFDPEVGNLPTVFLNGLGDRDS